MLPKEVFRLSVSRCVLSSKSGEAQMPFSMRFQRCSSTMISAQLRARLRHDWQFRTQSDTEVIVAASIGLV